MKLYTFELAPNPRRVALFNRYKGIELETEEINLGEGQQFSDSFRQLNERCTVPALVLDDGTVLSDVVTICLYLDAEYPDRSLFGRNALERAQVVGWMHRIFVEGLMAVAEILRNQGDSFQNRALPGPLDLPQIPELVERGRTRLHAFFQSLNHSLEGRRYLVGEQMTQADIDALVFCDFTGWVKEGIPEDCSHLQSWYQSVKNQLDPV